MHETETALLQCVALYVAVCVAVCVAVRVVRWCFCVAVRVVRWCFCVAVCHDRGPYACTCVCEKCTLARRGGCDCCE